MIGQSSDFGSCFAGLKRDLRALKWMTGLALALDMAILFRLFLH
jgi:hypothetical protein